MMQLLQAKSLKQPVWPVLLVPMQVTNRFSGGVFRLLIIFAVVVSAFEASADELRGLWVDAFGPGFMNKKQVKQMVGDCRRNNFNAVFVQMRPRGDALYFPKAQNLDPRNANLPADFDALQEIINECHSGVPRIQVHCWLVGYFIWAWDKPPQQKQHVFNKHPEWLTLDSLGQKMVGQGYYLDPGNPDANLALLNTAKDVVSRYEVDGLHWDYLRYPLQDSGYNPTALKRFKEEFGVTKKPEPNDPHFSEWRRRQITDFLRWSTAELLSIKPEIVISVAVFSSHKDAYDIRFQDWVSWNKEGIVDATIPMDFSKDDRFIFLPRANFAATNEWNRTIWLGQGAYMNTLKHTLGQLEYARQKGFSGTLLYSYRNPVPEETPGVEDLPHQTKNTASNNIEIIIDNKESQVVGSWNTGEYGKMHGDDYVFTSAGKNEAYVNFSPKLPVSGNYYVYEWHVAGKNRTTVSHTVKHHGGETHMNVDQRKNGSRWHLLGEFLFETNEPSEVRISSAAAYSSRVVVADAMRFVLADDSSSVPIDEDAAGKKAAEQAQRLRQKEAFAFIKEKYQPTWQNVPALPWKKDKGIIRGMVSRNDGTPIYNITVRLLDSLPISQKTEPHGTFAFFDVAPGEHTVEASFSNTETIQKKVTVKAGNVVGIAIFNEVGK